MTVHTHSTGPLSRRALLGAAVAAPALAVAGRALAQAPASLREAFLYAFPLYEFARTAQLISGAVGKAGTLNQLIHKATLADHTSRWITTPNNDTIYSTAYLDLSGGPLILDVPTIKDRYFSVAFMDIFTDNFAYIGTRATQGEGGRFWIVGPLWQNEVPQGVKLIRATSNDVWLLVRVLVEGPQDLAEAQAVQSQFVLSLPSGRAEARGFTHAAAADPSDPAAFLNVVNELLARSGGAGGHVARAERFAALGIGTDEAPSDTLLQTWAQVLTIGVKALRDGLATGSEPVQGWNYLPSDIGNYGENDLLRSLVALGGLGALTEDEAMYVQAGIDAGGGALNGAHSYHWTLPAGGVPVNSFWSLTLYEKEADGRYFLTDNPIHRYSIGDRTQGLVYEPDGSLIVVIAHERPHGRLAANWLPAPKGELRLFLRTYLPKAQLLTRQWRVPAVVRV